MKKPERTPDAELGLEGVIIKYYDAVRANALHVTRSEHTAADITQSVFTLLVERWDGLEHDRIGAWIFACERRKLLEFFRSARRESAVLSLDENGIEDGALSGVDSYFEITDDELDAVKERVLSVLSADERVLYEAYFTEGRSYEDICALYSLSYSAATSRVKRIRRKLEESIKNNGGDLMLILTALVPAALAIEILLIGRWGR